jgi:hypothetical protein
LIKSVDDFEVMEGSGGATWRLALALLIGVPVKSGYEPMSWG